jgi:hypothetical protein
MADSPEPVVKITLTKTYEKLDTLEKQVASDFNEIKLSLQEVQLTLRTFANHEKRIRDLEEYKWKQVGIVTFLATMPAGIFGFLISKLFG